MTSHPAPTQFGTPVSFTDPRLSLAMAAYLARFKGQSRLHTDSDLRVFLGWCTARGLDPLTAQRHDLELYVRWLQETRRYKPSTVSRRTSVITGFYRTCVIDGCPRAFAGGVRPTTHRPTRITDIGAHPPAVRSHADRRPHVHQPIRLRPRDHAGSAGPAHLEATGTEVTDLGEEHGHRVLRVVGKGTRVVLVPLPPAVGRAIDRAVEQRTAGPILLNLRGARMDRHAATRRLRHLAAVAGVRLPRMHPHMLRHTFVTTMLDAGVDLRDVQIAARHADPRTTMRYDRARKNLDRHPNYILAAYMSSGT